LPYSSLTAALILTSENLSSAAKGRKAGAFSGSLESLPVLLWRHGSQGDAKHHPETRSVAKFTQARTLACVTLSSP
jgi:hypothetical protein